MNEKFNFSFGYKTQCFNPTLLTASGLLLLLASNSHLVPKISKIVKKINKNFRPLDSIPSSLDYLSKWAALR
ncbi:hypothetical protein CDG79_24775 [Nostoc sp. 'Peltigera membranacea cyanobiont' 232]|nr:hypothetical protein CDG79_24775 [Nostoc sp. 'Peltigera membranacea cyanobiont' 232]